MKTKPPRLLVLSVALVAAAACNQPEPTEAVAEPLAPGSTLIFSRGPCAVPGSGVLVLPPAPCGGEAVQLARADATCAAAGAGSRAVHVQLVPAAPRTDGTCQNDLDFDGDLECCDPRCP